MKPEKDLLKKYKQKRDFEKTTEPKPKIKKSKAKNLLFVVQKHASRSLHYDFRIEISGVLASWAIPKGFSLNPAIKHLAVKTEDHPYDYAKFEGIIPEGQYGAGTVMVWDIGTYQNIKKENNKLVPIEECIKRGTIEIWLEGEKLHGGFALIKFHGQSAKEDNWLIIKIDDEYAKPNKDSLPKSWDKSALSGQTMNQIKKTSKNY